ncbi:hypothetical protein ACLOJK_019479 [Asimina triloba]
MEVNRGRESPRTEAPIRYKTYKINSFSGFVHTARHTVGAGHARSPYLNHKEGDVEGGASDWSEVVTRWKSSFVPRRISLSLKSENVNYLAFSLPLSDSLLPPECRPPFVAPCSRPPFMFPASVRLPSEHLAPRPIGHPHRPGRVEGFDYKWEKEKIWIFLSLVRLQIGFLIASCFMH